MLQNIIKNYTLEDLINAIDMLNQINLDSPKDISDNAFRSIQIRNIIKLINRKEVSQKDKAVIINFLDCLAE
jgi:hypothetical protein